jgi:hypothetical protein
VENIIQRVLDSLKEDPPLLASEVIGWTTPRVRMLLHRLVAELPKDEAYLEIGCFHGATLFSALMDQKTTTAYACDNFASGGDAEKAFYSGVNFFGDRLPPFRFFNESCWSLPKKKPFAMPIGVYFYDGDHAMEAHERAITEFAPFLAKRSIFVVDDWAWDFVREGTMRGIDKVKPKKVEKYLIDVSGAFWNGIGAFYLEQ